LLVVLLALGISAAGHGDESKANKDSESAGLRASLPTPSVYVTPNYNLTFHVPPKSFYCPLPRDWLGTDHGTVIFLESPGGCSGNGYASSDRGFERDVARIGIYYGWDFSEDSDESAAASKPCEAVGHSHFLGRDTPICKTNKDGKIILGVKGKYDADSPAEAEFVLITTADRFARDFAIFRALLISARPCSLQWTYGKSQTGRSGTGARCPSGAGWF
jgi:hypothetical protein